MNKEDLPKRIKSTITDDVYYLTLEERETDKEDVKRYIIHYLNPLRNECLFLVDSYNGYDYQGMFNKLKEDVFWKKA